MSGGRARLQSVGLEFDLDCAVRFGQQFARYNQRQMASLISCAAVGSIPTLASIRVRSVIGNTSGFYPGIPRSLLGEPTKNLLRWPEVIPWRKSVGQHQTIHCDAAGVAACLSSK